MVLNAFNIQKVSFIGNRHLGKYIAARVKKHHHPVVNLFTPTT